VNEHGVISQTADSFPPEEIGAQAISFVIRIWRERGPAGPEYRGWIEHVQSGQRTSFLGLNRLPSVIASHIGTGTRSRGWLRHQLRRWRTRMTAWFARGEEE
jgi:hypothetical protein